MARPRPCCKTRNPISDCSTAPPAPTFTRLSGKAWTISSTDGRVRPARCSTSCAGAMAYLVELPLRAERDLDYLYQRISADDSSSAARSERRDFQCGNEGR